MIVTTKARKIERLGEEAQEQVAYGIDPSATTHIARILRSMYTDPVAAIVREYLANAYDVHQVAGVPASKIKVYLPTQETSMFEVRDFGTGLSKADVEKYLFNFGASGHDKRENNTQIGGFGLGCKSAFAVSDSFVYTSHHNGWKGSWRCFLDEHDQGQAELVYDGATEEPNGVLIQIPIAPTSVDPCCKAFAEVAAYLEDAPEVARGLGHMMKSLGHQDQAVESWPEARQYLSKGEFREGAFDLNEKNMTWRWYTSSPMIYRTRYDRGFRMYIVQGWQRYQLDYNKISKTLWSPQITSLFNHYHNSNEMYELWAPIGTFPLSPTRETLQYTQYCQKLCIGAISGMLRGWGEMLKAEVKKPIKRMIDGSEMRGAAYRHLSWMEPQLNLKDANVTWKRPRRQGTFTSDGSGGTVSLSLPGIADEVMPVIHIRLRASPGHYNVAGQQDCSVNVYPADGQWATIETSKTVLVLGCANPKDLSKADVERWVRGYNNAHQLIKESQGDNVPVDVGGDWWLELNTRSGGREMSLLCLPYASLAEAVKAEPYLEGLPAVQMNRILEISAAWKIAHPNNVATAQAQGTVGPKVRAKPDSIDRSKYKHRFTGAIDIPTLKAAETRVYVREVRGDYFASGSTYRVTNTTDASKEFTKLISQLSPNVTVYPELLSYVSDGCIGPTHHPDRYGKWTDWHTWVLSCLETQFSKYLTGTQAGNIMHDWIMGNRIGIFTQDTERDYWSSSVFLGNCYYRSDREFGPDINELHNLFKWLESNVKSTYGRRILARLDTGYNILEPKVVDLSQCMQMIHSMDGNTAHWPQLLASNRYCWTKWQKELVKAMEAGGCIRHQDNALNWAPGHMFGVGALRWNWYSVRNESQWKAWCRHSWLVFESAWSCRKCPEFPPMPEQPKAK